MDNSKDLYHSYNFLVATLSKMFSDSTVIAKVTRIYFEQFFGEVTIPSSFKMLTDYYEKVRKCDTLKL